jgi:hypothetical protein
MATPTAVSTVGAAAAPAKDLEMVLDVAKAMLVGDVVGPPLDSGAFDLDGASAVAADEVVVVAHRAASVNSFTVAGADQVELAGVGHHQQRSVDGRQPNVLTLVAKVVVDLAGSAELVGAGEQVRDCGALPRLPLRGGYHLVLLRRREVTGTTIRQRFQ